MISPALLDILACPVCKDGVSLTEKQDHLLCGRCRLLFPIRDGIPVMLPQEATSLQERDIQTGKL